LILLFTTVARVADRQTCIVVVTVEMADAKEQFAHMHEVMPTLWLGDERASTDIVALERHGIRHVLSILDPCDHPGIKRLEDPSITYKRVWAADNSEERLYDHFDECAHWIDTRRKYRKPVLVYSKAGISRAPTIVAAYMINYTFRNGAGEALDHISKVRSVRPNAGFLSQLEKFRKTLRECHHSYQLIQRVPRTDDKTPCHRLYHSFHFSHDDEDDRIIRSAYYYRCACGLHNVCQPCMDLVNRNAYIEKWVMFPMGIINAGILWFLVFIMVLFPTPFKFIALLAALGWCVAVHYA